MVERKKIAIVYRYNENWIGGAYYFQNIIQAFNTYPEEQKPEITILCENEDDYLDLKKRTGYTYLSHLKYEKDPNFSQRFINALFRRFIGRNIFESRLRGNLFDCVYCSNMNFYLRLLNNKVEWIPDFQEEHLPHFFSEKEIETRRSKRSILAENSEKIVFSSKNAEDDFKRLYPKSKAETYIVRFAVTHPNIQISKEEIFAKYSIHEDYYLCSNQFWQHKNHKVIFEALIELKKQNVELPKIILTGKPYDFRAPEHYDFLLNMVEKNDLTESVAFLGFISREDQLALMKYSKAVLQPSLFEGWGTVVEDAKSLGKHVILSDIPVHREQMNENVSFFNPPDPKKLSEILQNFIEVPYSTNNYKTNINKFAKSFSKVLE